MQIEEDDINAIIKFINFLNDSFKVSSIWQAASCINKYLKIEKNFEFIKNVHFKSLMKKLEKNSKNNPVKSDVLTIRQVNDFVSDSNESLVIKVAVLIGVYGGLRVSELVSLDFGDFEKLENKFNITVQFSKTDQSGKGFVFIINAVPDAPLCPYKVIESYYNLFENKTGRFFRKIDKNGKPTMLPIGVNKMGTFPKIVAKFLQLDGHYTGHCFRRSSATILADSGVSVLQLQRHGRWSSSTIAESYVDNSEKSKVQISDMISGTNLSMVSNSIPSVNLSGNFSNCSFIIQK